MGSFANEAVVLLKYRPDPAALTPAYDRYPLENVMVREIFAADAEGTSGDGAVVYFLEKGSICRDPYGRTVGFPRLAKGDLCILHAGTPEEVTMRVAEAGYFGGSPLAHVRMKLK